MTSRLHPRYWTSSSEPGTRAVFTVARIVDFLFAVLYTVLGTRFLLDFFQARKGAGFYELVRSMSDPFYRPFQGLFGASHVDGHPVVWPLVAAILAYMILHSVVRGVLRLAARE
jgi:uncharacterized protein YggT (Ycf19 family)